MKQTPIRVLLLEDNPGDARLVQAALADYAPSQFAVTCVERLADALARLGVEPFDAMLCDLSVPDSEGMATLQVIIERFPLLPLVVLTGGSHDAKGLLFTSIHVAWKCWPRPSTFLWRAGCWR